MSEYNNEKTEINQTSEVYYMLEKDSLWLPSHLSGATQNHLLKKN